MPAAKYRIVIAGLDPAIHPLRKKFLPRRWTPGSSPGVTHVGAPALAANPTPSRALLGARTNGAATHVEGAFAACGGAGGVRGLERRRPPPPSRLLRLRRAQPIELRRLAARPRRPKSGPRPRAGQRAGPGPRSAARSEPRSEPRSETRS